MLRNGVPDLAKIHDALSQWLDDHGHASLAEIRGVMSLARYDNPEDFKRAGYAKVLNRYW